MRDDEVDAPWQAKRAGLEVVEGEHILQRQRERPEHAPTRLLGVERREVEALALQVDDESTEDAELVAIAIGWRWQRPRRPLLCLHDLLQARRQSAAARRCIGGIAVLGKDVEVAAKRVVQVLHGNVGEVFCVEFRASCLHGLLRAARLD
jgi:hypothetical protein